MDTREIHYILTIHELGSITRASEALHISQPSLSRCLINIEKKLGKKYSIAPPRPSP